MGISKAVQATGNMTPAEIGAWVQMAREGTLRRWINAPHVEWKRELARRSDGSGERVFAALGTSTEFIPRAHRA